MVRLNGTHIGLRALEPEDLGFLYTLENTAEIWEVSETLEPFSRSVLQDYLKHASEGIRESGQLRLLIYSLTDNRSLGFLDFYDFDSLNDRVGLGIAILRKEDRGKGFGKESLALGLDYAFKVLHVHQVFANIPADNEPSIHLFESVGFNCQGRRKDWTKASNGYKDQLIYQKFSHEKP